MHSKILKLLMNILVVKRLSSLEMDRAVQILYESTQISYKYRSVGIQLLCTNYY